MSSKLWRTKDRQKWPISTNSSLEQEEELIEDDRARRHAQRVKVDYNMDSDHADKLSKLARVDKALPIS